MTPLSQSDFCEISKKVFFLSKETDIYKALCRSFKRYRRKRTFYEISLGFTDDINEIIAVCKSNPYQKISLHDFGINYTIKYCTIPTNNDKIALILLLKILKIIGYNNETIKSKLKKISTLINYE